MAATNDYGRHHVIPTSPPYALDGDTVNNVSKRLLEIIECTWPLSQFSNRQLVLSLGNWEVSSLTVYTGVPMTSTISTRWYLDLPIYFLTSTSVFDGNKRPGDQNGTTLFLRVTMQESRIIKQTWWLGLVKQECMDTSIHTFASSVMWRVM